MTAPIVFPAIPGPSSAPIVADDRRMTSAAGGYFEARAVQRDRVATRQLTFPPYTAAEAATFWAWWRDDLYLGGARFYAPWRLANGAAGAVYQFKGAPTSRLVNDLEQITATVTVHGIGVAPVQPTAELICFDPAYLPTHIGSSTAALSNYNQTLAVFGAPGSGSVGQARSARPRTQRAFFRVRVDADSSGTGIVFGFSDETYPASYRPGYQVGSIGWQKGGTVNSDGSTVATFETWGVGDVMEGCIDPATGMAWLAKNGAWHGDPVEGTGGIYCASLVGLAHASIGGDGFGAYQMTADFQITEVAGFTAWDQGY